MTNARRRDTWLDLFFDILRVLKETHQDRLLVREIVEVLRVDASPMTVRRMLHYLEDKKLVSSRKKRAFHKRESRWTFTQGMAYSLTKKGGRLIAAWLGPPEAGP